MEGQQHDTEVVERPEISAGKSKSADSSAVENAVPEAPIDSDNSPLTENDLFQSPRENIPSVLHVQSEEDLYEILDCMGFITVPSASLLSPTSLPRHSSSTSRPKDNNQFNVGNLVKQIWLHLLEINNIRVDLSGNAVVPGLPVDILGDFLADAVAGPRSQQKNKSVAAEEDIVSDSPSMDRKGAKIPLTTPRIGWSSTGEKDMSKEYTYSNQASSSSRFDSHLLNQFRTRMYRTAMPGGMLPRLASLAWALCKSSRGRQEESSQRRQRKRGYQRSKPLSFFGEI